MTLNSNGKITWTFSGRYAVAQENIASRAVMFFGCTPVQAERLAQAFAADYGNWKKSTKEDGVTLRFGAIKSDGSFKIQEIEAMESTGLASPALSITRIIYYADRLFTLKNGIIPADCSIALIKQLSDWLFQVKETEPVKDTEPVSEGELVAK